MKTLVLGGSGLVGAQLMKTLAACGDEVRGTWCSRATPGLEQLDLRDAEAVRRCIADSGASVVYLAAALTNVDRCETHPQESFAVNVEGTRVAAASGVRLVYFSSDYVFPGDSGPYRESDTPRPLNVYGRHKLAAEQALPADALVVRTTGVYGPEGAGKNFVYRVWSTLRRGERLAVPNDQIANPTYAPNLAAAAVELERRGARGTYHLAGGECVDRFGFALEIARVLDLDPTLVQPVSTEALGQPAPRPRLAGLVCDKAAAELSTELIGYRRGLLLFRAAA